MYQPQVINARSLLNSIDVSSMLSSCMFCALYTKFTIWNTLVNVVVIAACFPLHGVMHAGRFCLRFLENTEPVGSVHERSVTVTRLNQPSVCLKALFLPLSDSWFQFDLNGCVSVQWGFGQGCEIFLIYSPLTDADKTKLTVNLLNQLRMCFFCNDHVKMSTLRKVRCQWVCDKWKFRHRDICRYFTLIRNITEIGSAY